MGLGAPFHNPLAPSLGGGGERPRLATCECWLRRRQHNRQHMQFTRKEEKPVKSRKPALGTFRKKSVGRQRRVTFYGREGATSIVMGSCTGVKHAMVLQHPSSWAAVQG